MLKWRGYGHLGGAMSIVELLSVLYNDILRYKPEVPAGKTGIMWCFPRDIPGPPSMRPWLCTASLTKNFCIP